MTKIFLNSKFLRWKSLAKFSSPCIYGRFFISDLHSKFNVDTLLIVPFWLPDPDGWSHQFERAGGEERGYSDFRTIFNHFYSKADFNKLYGYGCYCSNIGSGTGQRQTSGRIGSEMSADPIDEKDALCKSWSMCVRCAQHDFGDQCSTNVNYKYRLG